MPFSMQIYYYYYHRNRVSHQTLCISVYFVYVYICLSIDRRKLCAFIYNFAMDRIYELVVNARIYICTAASHHKWCAPYNGHHNDKSKGALSWYVEYRIHVELSTEYVTFIGFSSLKLFSSHLFIGKQAYTAMSLGNSIIW